MAYQSTDPEVIKLQLAMAFGQGAGTILASAEALEYLLSETELNARANRLWPQSRFIFVHLMRLAGQIAATTAAANGRWEISAEDARGAMGMVSGATAMSGGGPCPCT